MEDEALLAVMVAELLESAGATIVGPAATLQRARVLAESGNIDLALLDVSLFGAKKSTRSRPCCPLARRPSCFHGLGEAPGTATAPCPDISRPRLREEPISFLNPTGAERRLRGVRPAGPDSLSPIPDAKLTFICPLSDLTSVP